jgi:hypothetical protein
MPKPNPARVKLSEQKSTDFLQFITDQLNRAISARGDFINDGGLLDTWHALYEQAPRPEAELPFDGAADLSTYLVTEKVDGMSSRLVSIIFNSDPICVAECFEGADPVRTARVETFHQWQAEEEKVKLFVPLAIKMALIEQSGVLAVEECPVMTKVKREADVLIDTTDHGEPNGSAKCRAPADRATAGTTASGTTRRIRPRQHARIIIANPLNSEKGVSLVGDDGLIEIKCPNTSTHVETLLSETIAGKYHTQMQWQMACTGRQWCDFVSFDPRMPASMQLWIKRIDRDNKRISELEEQVQEFLAELDAQVRALREKYEARELAA